MGRHRHTACVRSDGLLATVGPLLDGRRVVAATLVDVSSGLLLDGYSHDPDLPDLELLGALHADLARAAAALAAARGEEDVVVGHARYHHVLRRVADPHGDPLLLAAVVHGAHRHARRARRHLRRVPLRGLTTGPAVDRRLLRRASTPTPDAARPAPYGDAAPPPVPDGHDRASPPAVPPHGPGAGAVATPPSAMAPALLPTRPARRP